MSDQPYIRVDQMPAEIDRLRAQIASVQHYVDELERALESSREDALDAEARLARCTCGA